EARCVDPEHGAMVVAEPGTSQRLVVAVGDPATVARATVGDVEGTPDALGLARLDVEVSFGMNHVPIVVELVDGRRVERLCSFLAADRYHPSGETLPDAVTMRLAPVAVDDGDLDATRLESIGDVFLAIIEAGALE